MRATVDSETSAKVTLTMKEIRHGRWPLREVVIHAGETLIYTGTCGDKGMSWEPSGTIPSAYLPRS